jgi:predicted dehydrogenase
MSSTPADQSPTSADRPSTAADQSASEAPPTRARAGIRFAAVGLDHSHIYGQISGLLGQGCQLVGISSDDPDASVAAEVRSRWPDVPWFDDPEPLFKDDRIDLIVTAAVPDRRASIAVWAMRNGKDVVSDKPGCVSFDQLEQVSNAVAETGRFWSVTFSERFEVRCVARAGELVRAGRIGQVVQTLGLGPHREGDRAHLAGGAGRPDWFYDHDRFGGIITDIASHQIDQFLWFTGSTTAEVVASTVANYTHPDHPKMQDFGEVLLRSESAQGYIRVDWYTPRGLPTWGDGRLIVLGTEGYLEMRKYVDLQGRPGGDHLFLVDQEGTHYIDCSDVPLTYYEDLVHDVRERTTTACPQAHTLEVMRLALEAQQRAARRGAAR